MAAATDESLSEVFRLLRDRAGMDPQSFGLPGIAHVVKHRVSASGADSRQDYLRRLLLDPAEFQALLEELVVPETWFFRDMLAFRHLASYLDTWHPANRGTVRLLSVACSTGEEVYSQAITLREAGLEPSRFRILGTDVSRKSLGLAQEGRFHSRSFRNPDEGVCTLRARWFERVGESWRVRDELRTGLEFRCDNLAQAEFLAGEPSFHVVFCRNVLIYFHAEARRAAVCHLHRLLRPDGLLFSAPAEARIIAEAGFRAVGGECPFAFCRQDDLAKTPAPAERVTRREVTLPPAPPQAGLAMTSAPSPARRDTDPEAPSSGVDAAVEEPSGEALLRAAQQAADNGRLEEADAFCGRLLSQDVASAEAHYLQGVVRQAQGLLSEAQRSLEKALYLDPRHYQSLVHLALLAERRGDPLGAANYRRRARQVAPREAE